LAEPGSPFIAQWAVQPRLSLSVKLTVPMARNFLTGAELDAHELGELLARAAELKRAPLSSQALAGRSVALLFQRPSTRTRVSFEVGVCELGGSPLVLMAEDLQLTRGESPRDTALVLSRHVAAIGIRTGPQAIVDELAEHATVPVLNMLTEEHHPCQALADLLTVQEAFGEDALSGVRLAYVGDGNNVARSLAIVGALAGAEVAIASPPAYALARETIPLAPNSGGSVLLYEDPREAVTGASVIYTDVWVSMGQETKRTSDVERAQERRRTLEPYRIDPELLAHARPEAIVMHCLPAHPGEEIAPELLYGSRQRIWDQAENRRHAQKALLELLLR
jgi:ornithine carbamoyltransferase